MSFQEVQCLCQSTACDNSQWACPYLHKVLSSEQYHEMMIQVNQMHQCTSEPEIVKTNWSRVVSISSNCSSSILDCFTPGGYFSSIMMLCGSFQAWDTVDSLTPSSSTISAVVRPGRSASGKPVVRMLIKSQGIGEVCAMCWIASQRMSIAATAASPQDLLCVGGFGGAFGGRSSPSIPSSCWIQWLY